MDRKKISLFIGGVVFILFLIFLVATFAYQQVVNEGLVLADERCLTIDPVINKKKDMGFHYAEMLNGPAPMLDTVHEFTTITEQLPTAFSETISISEPWLEKQRAYLDSWQFKFFTPKLAKENLNAQYDKYYADFESNKFMLELMQDPKNEVLGQKVRDAIERQKQAGNLWDEKFDALQKSFDFRSRFIRAPQTQCIDSHIYDSPAVDPEKVGYLSPLRKIV